MRRLGSLAGLVLAVPSGLAGCSSVTLRDPATGATASCTKSLLWEINPWSKSDLCIEEYETEGWKPI